MWKIKFLLAKLIKAELKSARIYGGANSRGAEQRIPDRKGLAKIGVSLGVGARMVQMVELGRDDELADDRAEPTWQCKVCMREKLDKKREPSIGNYFSW